jgi:hypothetical protein
MRLSAIFAGHVSKQMLQHYSHVRMGAKCETSESIVSCGRLAPATRSPRHGTRRRPITRASPRTCLKVDCCSEVPRPLLLLHKGFAPQVGLEPTSLPLNVEALRKRARPRLEGVPSRRHLYQSRGDKQEGRSRKKRHEPVVDTPAPVSGIIPSASENGRIVNSRPEGVERLRFVCCRHRAKAALARQNTSSTSSQHRLDPAHTGLHTLSIPMPEQLPEPSLSSLAGVQTHAWLSLPLRPTGRTTLTLAGITKERTTRHPPRMCASGGTSMLVRY